MKGIVAYFCTYFLCRNVHSTLFKAHGKIMECQDSNQTLVMHGTLVCKGEGKVREFCGSVSLDTLFETVCNPM